MASVLPFDELNRFVMALRDRFPDGNLPQKPQGGRSEEEDIIDELLDLCLLSYAMGNNVTNANLSSSYTPSLDEINDTVNAEVSGKTWKDRVEDYFANGGSVDDIVRIAETETHRIANTAAITTAKKAGARFKTWQTMLDERVRSTHDYLEGETVPIDEDFYTYDGDHASAPGLFELAENNVNCRCELLFS